MTAKQLRTFLFGRRLKTQEEDTQRIGITAAVPILGLGALSSASYGPEAAMTVLIPLGAAGLSHVAPLMLLVVGLLALVHASYRQTIAVYPQGGGSYDVARENLGTGAGLLAGGALWIDYVLNVAVAISAGVGALVSMMPALLPHTLPLCLGILLLLTVINLRGVRDSGAAFMVPTYLFVVLLGGIIVVGLVKVVLADGHPQPVVAPRTVTAGTEAASLWLLLRAFAAGCTSMTGIEAVSNAVPVFRPPAEKNARRTLLVIVTILAGMIASLAVICPAFGIGATPPGRAGYESVVSQTVAAISGRGLFYYVTMGSVVAVLCLSANTSFASFPRLCRMLADDRFLPPGFAHQGARLVYSQGIVLLAALAGGLLVVFGGITDRLIPLFAVGAFLAFTMSQVGMVAHWWRHRNGTRIAELTNLVGALATGATLVIMVVAKFGEGAWITVVLLGLLLLLFLRVRAHLDEVDVETSAAEPVDFTSLDQPIVVVPIKRLDKVARKALRFAATIGDEVEALQVLATRQDTHDLSNSWPALVVEPARAAGVPPPKLVVLRSSYREVVDPVVSHVLRLSKVNAGRPIAVIVPEVVERRWYHFFLHSHRATLLKALLLFRGGPQVVVINTPWYLAAD